MPRASPNGDSNQVPRVNIVNEGTVLIYVVELQSSLRTIEGNARSPKVKSPV